MPNLVSYNLIIMTEVVVYQYQTPKLPKEKVWAVNRLPAKELSRRLLLGMAVLGLLILASPLLILETKWRLRQLKMKTSNDFLASQFAKVIQASDLSLLQPKDSQFSVVIPKIEVNSQVTAQVSPVDKEEYRLALKDGVAHAEGSFLPGQEGTVYLFGHSIDYLWKAKDFDASFYLLGKLEPGDEVDVFYNSQRFVYQVTDRRVVNADQVEYLQKQSGEEKLVLQTCWPPGTTWKRLIVLAKKA